MERWLVAKTRYEGLRRLSVSDMLAQDSWPQIEGYLTSVRGEGGADLFAEPVTSADGSILWYASGKTAPVAASAMGEDERQALLSQLETEHGAIREVANYLLQDAKAPRRRLGALIEAALEFATSTTGEEVLYAVDGKPVLVNWGARLDVPEPPTDPLRDYVSGARRRSKPPVPTPVAQEPPVIVPADPIRPVIVARQREWGSLFWWLLLAFLVATLFFMLLAPCGIRGLFGERSCPGFLQQAGARGSELEAEIAILEDQLAKAPACADEFARRREDAGGQTGAVTITLIWEDIADLDLSVVCPAGGTIMFEKRQACGGVLDIDANNKAATATMQPIENIYFSDAPTGGKYQIQVHKFVKHKTGPWYRPGPVPFKVQISRNGQTTEIPGVVTDDQRVIVKEF